MVWHWMVRKSMVGGCVGGWWWELKESLVPFFGPNLGRKIKLNVCGGWLELVVCKDNIVIRFLSKAAI